MIGEAIESPHPPIEPESFTVIFAEEISGATLAEALPRGSHREASSRRDVRDAAVRRRA